MCTTVGYDSRRGWLFLNNRYHDPTLGVFLSVDPLVSSTGEPYIYASGTPTTLSDPTGLCAINYGNMAGDDGKPCTGDRAGGSSANPVVNQITSNLNDGDSEFNIATNWRILDNGVMPDDYWNPGGANLCFGSLACNMANLHWARSGYKDFDGAAKIAATYCMENMQACVEDQFHAENNAFLSQVGSLAVAAYMGTFNRAASMAFATGEGSSVLAPERLQHGTRHLVENGVLPAWSGKSSPALIEQALVPVLEGPSLSYLKPLKGGQTTRAFLGQVGGTPVVVEVYASGPSAGLLATSYVVGPGNMTTIVNAIMSAS